MTVEKKLSRSISGQVPNHVGTQLHVPQNGNHHPSQKQNLGAHRDVPIWDPEEIRKHMQMIIHQFLKDRLPQGRQMTHEQAVKIVRRLEHGLFKDASSQAEYMDLNTLETRLLSLIKSSANYNRSRQVPQQTNFKSTIDRRIPNQRNTNGGNGSLDSVDASEGKCRHVKCETVKQLREHMATCDSKNCTYKCCKSSRKLTDHQKHCIKLKCPVCVDVNIIFHEAQVKKGIVSGVQVETMKISSSKMFSFTETVEDVQPWKRIKTEHPFKSLEALSKESSLLVPKTKDLHVPQSDIFTSGNSELMDVEIDDKLSSKEESHPVVKKEPPSVVKQEKVTENVSVQIQQENMAEEKEHTGATMSTKPTINGVSLTELFTPEQIKEHISGLKQGVPQIKSKAEKNQVKRNVINENACQLCAVELFTFEPLPYYCSLCGSRIKRNAMYYTVGIGETRNCCCTSCYNDSRGDIVSIEGREVSKKKLEKKKNNEVAEESWVQCGKCDAWQHQICALFNVRRNVGGQAEYTCPYCYLKAFERGERDPLPQSSVLGAKDLPRTLLSDQIEERLSRKLKQERQDRARNQCKIFDEVPGAEDLIVRVVSLVEKKLEVKPRFLEMFKEENYPTEFPFKSKVLLLFQKIEGVEVCLFGLYVQEFGSECPFPNQRRVYISYLDSVKYFRPEIRAASGEALRTFVYHEILIGYLEHCKQRGFVSCYIWACPPLKGEDYILYCHPPIQKTPKSDKLREWYVSMLRKASKENIVVEITNLYDQFFTCTGECKTKVTAARVPYFEGDYWPGAAEDAINQIRQEEDDKKTNKKVTTKKPLSKRALKASGYTDLSSQASKDLLLMHKLGEIIFPMKEDFIMVHLQHSCTHCTTVMVSGNRWVCSQCQNFQLCDRCYDSEQKVDQRHRHPINQKEKHILHPVEITDVPTDTTDKEEIIESEFFDTRLSILSLCQANHYQYDTLRRAKHSSMMILYHLHNPTAPFAITCQICHLEIEAGQGWRCQICSDYDVCNACHNKDGGVKHPHELTNHNSSAEPNGQNKEARQQRFAQLRKILDLLVHTSQCQTKNCSYLNCRKVRGLFYHGMNCKTRAHGGCVICRKMWCLLQLHARSCKETTCHVPRCRDLREHAMRVQQQADSRRRIAVTEMMRQRATERNNTSG